MGLSVFKYIVCYVSLEQPGMFENISDIFSGFAILHPFVLSITGIYSLSV